MNEIQEPGYSHHVDYSSAGGEFPLIGQGDPPPFMTYNMKGSAPVLLVADHAAPYFPASMNQLGVADWVLEKHVTWDIGSDMLTRCLADMLDAPAVMAGFSRLIVDPNRQLDDPSAFIEVSDGIAIPGNLDLSEEEKKLRVKSFFNPYHDAISKRLRQFSEQGIVPAFISVHTCTPVFAQVVRPWHVGVMWDKDPRIAMRMIEKLNSMEEICIGNNEPYSGAHPHDFTIDHHAEPAGLPHVGIEVRQDLVAEPEGARKWAGVLEEALRDVLSDTSLYQSLNKP